MYKIRFLKDENEIVKLFPLCIAEGKNIGADVTKLNPDKLWANLRHDMEYAAIIVAEIDGEFVGLMALCLVDCYWKDELSLTNRIYWVSSEHRKSRVGVDILTAAKEYAIARKLGFDLHVESYEDLDRKDAFFKRKGFVRCGGSYILRGNNA